MTFIVTDSCQFENHVLLWQEFSNALLVRCHSPVQFIAECFHPSAVSLPPVWCKDASGHCGAECIEDRNMIIYLLASSLQFMKAIQSRQVTVFLVWSVRNTQLLSLGDLNQPQSLLSFSIQSFHYYAIKSESCFKSRYIAT